MRALITYFSVTGNTEIIARTILDALSDLVGEVQIKPITAIDPTGLGEFDVVFVGSACHDADLAKPVKAILDDIPTSTPIKMAGFVTHATKLAHGGPRDKELFERWAGKCEHSLVHVCQEKGIGYLGYFHCQGKPSSDIAEFIHREIITEDEEWTEYIEEVNLHPTQEDISRAKDFAKQVIEQINT
jgi:flavodoxin